MDFKYSHAFSLNNVSYLPAQSRTVPTTTGITLIQLTMCLLAGLLVCARHHANPTHNGGRQRCWNLWGTSTLHPILPLTYKPPLFSDLGRQHAFPTHFSGLTLPTAPPMWSCGLFHISLSIRVRSLALSSSQLCLLPHVRPSKTDCFLHLTIPSFQLLRGRNVSDSFQYSA